MPSKKIIIGLVGEAGSGKDTAGDYLQEKYGAKMLRFQDPLREALENFFEKGKVGREQMIWLSSNIRGKYGNDVIAKALKRRINEIQEGIVVLNGMRIAEDVDFIKSFSNSIILYVTLDQKRRWEEIYERGEKSDDAVSFEKFQEMENAETEVQIPGIGKKANYSIENSGTKADLLAKIDEIMEKIT